MICDHLDTVSEPTCIDAEGMPFCWRCESCGLFLGSDRPCGIHPNMRQQKTDKEDGSS